MADFGTVYKKLMAFSKDNEARIAADIAKSIKLLSVRMAKALQDKQWWNYQSISQVTGLLEAEMQKAGLLDIADEFRQTATKDWEEISKVPIVDFSKDEAGIFAAATQVRMKGFEKMISDDVSNWLADRLTKQVINPVSGSQLAIELVDKFDTTTKNAAVWVRDALTGQVRDTFQLAGQNIGADWWEFIGPEDERTRDECLADLQKQYFTTDEMQASDIGSRYNCRHTFIPLSSNPTQE